jgi:hypothetical protein
MRSTRNRSKRGKNLRQPNLDVTRSRFVPPRNWLTTHIASFPQHQRQTLSYYTSGTLAPTAGSYAEYNTLLNSPFDPDPSLGGLSATGFAKYMAVYTKCFVQAARYKVKFLNSTGVPNVSGCTVTTSSTSLGSALAAVSSGLSQYDLMQSNPDHRTYIGSVDIGKFLDKPDVLDDPQLFCTASANPAQLIVLHAWVSNSSATAASLVIATFEVEFDCVFTDPTPFT